MYITAQGRRLRNDLYCVEWDVKLYHTIHNLHQGGCVFALFVCLFVSGVMQRLWLGSVVVRVLDLQSTGRGFDFRPPHCRVATLGKSFTRAQRL